MRRISSNAFTYVTGFERGDLPIGLWSMPTTSSMRLDAGEAVERADLLAEVLLGAVLAVQLASRARAAARRV